MSIPPIEIKSTTKLYALIGSPVQHSLSPLIHNTSFEILGLDAVYRTFEVRDLAEALRSLKEQNVQGFNITIPYKETVMPFLDGISVEAQTIGAVNTVAVKNGSWVGHNTDAAGFSRTLKPFANDISRKNILLLGAGGAARAILYALLSDFEPKEIFIFNRTQERVLKMISEFKTLRPDVYLHNVLINEINERDIKLVINASTVGMNSNESLLERSFFKSGMIAYDLIYNPSETAFIHHARACGALGINGTNMLIEQASAAFEIWTGQVMPVTAVRKKLAQKS